MRTNRVPVVLLCGVGITTLALLVHQASADNNQQPIPPEAKNAKGISRSEVKRQLQARVDELKRSGADRRNVKTAIAELAAGWKEVATRLHADVTISAPDCFTAGCMVMTRHASTKGIGVVLAEFAHRKVFFRWNGGKFRSAPLEAPNGQAEVTWIFYSPKPGDAVLQPEASFAGFDDAPQTKGAR